VLQIAEEDGPHSAVGFVSERTTADIGLKARREGNWGDLGSGAAGAIFLVPCLTAFLRRTGKPGPVDLDHFFSLEPSRPLGSKPPPKEVGGLGAPTGAVLAFAGRKAALLLPNESPALAAKQAVCLAIAWVQNDHAGTRA